MCADIDQSDGCTYYKIFYQNMLYKLYLDSALTLLI